MIRGILLGQLVWYGKILVRWGRTRDGFVCAPGIRDARFSCRSSALVVVRPYLVGTMLLGKFGFKFDKLPCEQLYRVRPYLSVGVGVRLCVSEPL